MALKEAFSPNPEGVRVHLKKEFLDEDSDDYFERLKETVPWTKKEWKVGRFLPRMVYSYTPEIDPPNDALDELMLLCSETYECNAYAAWCNYYRDGNDHTPFHQDSYGKCVFTYSFGCSRTFVTQNIETGGGKQSMY